MTSPFSTIFPDVRLRIQDYLRTHHFLTDVSAKVAPNMKGYSSDLFWVEVTEAPGSAIIPYRLSQRNFSYNCYAPTMEETRNLAERVRAAMLQMRGVYTDLVVTQVTVGVEPFDLTDQIDNRYRFVLDMYVYVRPY